MALYALASELALTPQRVSEPPLGEIRLQWWRDALRQIRAGEPSAGHPIVTALAEAGIDSRSCECIEAAIDARARLLYPDPFSRAETFADWCDEAEGGVAETAWRFLTGRDAAAAARQACVAYAIARDARRLVPNFASDALAIAGELRAAARRMLGAIRPEAMPAIAHCALTGAHIRTAELGPIAKRVLVFRAMLTGRI